MFGALHAACYHSALLGGNVADTVSFPQHLNHVTSIVMLQN
jgi:hypothetical protein